MPALYKPDNLQATEVTLERTIENAIKDLDSATARTLNADQERLNELMRKSGSLQIVSLRHSRYARILPLLGNWNGKKPILHQPQAACCGR